MTVIHGQRLVVLIILLKFVGHLDTYGHFYQPWPSRFTSLEQQCGISDTPVKRIVGGTIPPIHTYPWMVVIFVKSSSMKQPLRFICGGALITKNHFLTAAHCVERRRPSNLVLRLGEHDISDNVRPVTCSAAEFIVHPRYHANHFDVAIIKLNETIKFGYAIKPICLPTADMMSRTFEGAMPFAAGWGQQSDDDKTPNSKLRHVQLEVISNKACEAANRPAFKITQEQLCVVFKSEQRGICHGDSGGPLMLAIKNKWYVIGVVSGGLRCGDPRYPGIFGRVTAVLSWIEDSLKINNRNSNCRCGR